jgi:hypothetical protein
VRRGICDVVATPGVQFALVPVPPVPTEPLVPPEPVAPEPVAPEPVAPEPVAPEPVAPEPVAPEPVAPEPVAPEPVAPGLPVPAAAPVPDGASIDVEQPVSTVAAKTSLQLFMALTLMGSSLRDRRVEPPEMFGAQRPSGWPTPCLMPAASGGVCSSEVACAFFSPRSGIIAPNWKMDARSGDPAARPGAPSRVLRIARRESAARGRSRRLRCFGRGRVGRRRRRRPQPDRRRPLE